MTLQINGVNMTNVQVNGNNMNILQVDGVVKWRRPFTYTRGSLPIGVASISAEINYSVELYSERVLATSDTIYFGEYINITATPSTGYNNPTIGSVPNPVSANVTGANYVTAGSIKSYKLTIPSITGVKDIKVMALIDGVSGQVYNNNMIPHGTSLTITASAEVGYNNPTVTSTIEMVQAVDIGDYIIAGSVKSYTLTISAITGVATQNVFITSSPLKGTTIDTENPLNNELSHNATIHYGDILTISATKVTGYNSPTVTGSPVTVSGNVATSSYITRGSVISYTFTKSTISNLTSYRVRRTSSPLQGAPSTVLTGGETLYYNDILDIDELYPATGWRATATTPITVTTNILTSSYITMSRRTYTVTLYKSGGTGGTSSVTATWGLAMPSATAPSRSGYNFQGYFYNTLGSGDKYYNANMTSARNWDRTSNVTLYAHWLVAGPSWVQTTGTFNTTAYMSATSDPGVSGVQSFLTTNYPPGNYASGYRFQVIVYHSYEYHTIRTEIFVRS